jgi:hypothetical protein
MAHKIETIKPEDSPFKGYNKLKYIMYYVEYYGFFDGDHHKKWVLDRIARIAYGSTPVISKHTFEDGRVVYDVSFDNPSKQYLEWVEGIKEEDGEYDEGLPP